VSSKPRNKTLEGEMKTGRIVAFDMVTGRTRLNRRNVIMKVHWEAVRCKFCGEQERVVHYGRTPKGTQRYLCQECGRTFLDNKAPERKQFSTEVIASALSQFYESASLAKIQRHLHLHYGVEPDRMTIYRWIIQYSDKAVRVLSSVPVKVGPTWVADETVLKLKAKGGSKAWFWDIIDERTRFLLASHLSESRGARDAQALMEKAALRATRTPREVVTDKLASYIDGLELAFGADTKHIQAKRLTAKPGTQKIERFHSTLKDRTKVLRAFLRRGTARKLLEGWLVHYNWFRPHSALGGRTPAEMAGAKAPFRNWKDVVRGES
jgi:transposase-like protein